ncbi:hypothetical protein QBC37DRAFT_99721 [Rhypophila decipiens]|uniref:Uncharacterized protein n=1 Tax=Rhypophila decipiens TaxID=261697 RepID=A0AAN7B283_9PEZI|nr:hypothetical protein QBC37DRAFT_99721 [Rhypophila decipiens]
MRLAQKEIESALVKKNLGKLALRRDTTLCFPCLRRRLRTTDKRTETVHQKRGDKRGESLQLFGSAPFCVCFVVSIEFTLLFSLRKRYIYLGRLPVLSWLFCFFSIMTPFIYLPNDIGSNTLLLIILVVVVWIVSFFQGPTKPGDGCWWCLDLKGLWQIRTHTFVYLLLSCLEQAERVWVFFFDKHNLMCCFFYMGLLGSPPVLFVLARYNGNGHDSNVMTTRYFHGEKRQRAGFRVFLLPRVRAHTCHHFMSPLSWTGNGRGQAGLGQQFALRQIHVLG